MDKDAERRIIELLKDGEALQSSIPRSLGLSRSRVSEVLSELERRNLIVRRRIGRNYVVSLSSAARPGRRIRLGIIRSSEYGYVVPLSRILRDRGYELEIRIYENGADVMRELASGRLEFGISPLVMQIFMASLRFPIRIVAPAGSGGAHLFGRSSMERLRALTSRLSTMELLLRTAVNQSMLREPSSVEYFDDPADAVLRFTSGRADVISIWEPFATQLRRMGYSELADYGDEHYCCSLSAHSSIDSDFVESFVRLFQSSIQEYTRNPQAYAPAYASLLGLPYSIVSDSIRSYRYHYELDAGIIRRQLELAGIRVPSPSSIEELVS
ncbi:MAG: DUF7343 domain-containing protein [Nitrososphaeria archaeon]